MTELRIRKLFTLAAMNAVRLSVSVPIILTSQSVGDGAETLSEHVLKALRFCNDKNAHVAILRCKAFWDSSHYDWMEQLQLPSSRWVLPDPRFHDMIESNTIHSVKTIVIIPALDSQTFTCLDNILDPESYFYLVDLILIANNTDNNKSITRVRRLFSGSRFHCIVPQDNCTDGELNALEPPSTRLSLSYYSQECMTLYSGRKSRKNIEEAFKGNVICAACYHRAKPSCRCHYGRSAVIANALHFCNATLSVSFYPDTASINQDIFKGTIDIRFEVSAATYASLTAYSIPPVVVYSHETFYSTLGKREPASFFLIVVESKRAFFLVLAVLLSSLILLRVADILEFRFSSIAMTLDFGMFFVASFFATSSPAPPTRRWTLSRKLVCGVWLVSILPLSNYMRSELTSRLSILSPPDSIDTLDELEHGLNGDSLSLCLASNSVIEYDLKRNHTGSALYAKLSSLYLKQEIQHAFSRQHPADCLRCAETKGHICLIDHISKWDVNMMAPRAVESAEKWRPLFGVTPVRKNYLLAKAYASLLRPAFEASLFKLDIQDSINNLQYGITNASWTGSRRSEQVKEIRIFFSCFFGILGVARLVLVVEILIMVFEINKGKKDKKLAITQSPPCELMYTENPCLHLGH